MRVNKSKRIVQIISILFTGILFTFTSCENFLKGGEIRKQIEADIAYANAPDITVTVSPQNNAQGQVTTGTRVTVKIGYPFTVNFVVDEAYNFGGWAAYQNFTSITDTPLSDEYVEFSDEDGKGPGKSSKCSVTIKQHIDNLWIVPVCGSKPSVIVTEPLSAEKDISITTPIKITFNKKMDLSSIQEKDEDGKVIGFKNFKVTYSSSDEEGDAATGDVTDYFDAAKASLKKNGMQIVIPFKEKLDSSKWLPQASYITVELGANIACDLTEGGAPLDKSYTWTFVTGATGDVKGPVIKSSSLAIKNGSSETVLEPKSWNDWADFQKNRIGSGYISFKYSVKADDSVTGDSGVSRYEITQRLMYADKGAKLPNGSILNTGTQFFNKNGEWNEVLGCYKKDFEVTTEVAGDEKGLENLTRDFASLFTQYPTDGIYQIMITAVDSLENYSEVPVTYYFVRDTTPPSLKTNEANIEASGVKVISDGVINGLYATSSNNSITFKSKNTIIDEGLFSESGNSLQTASKTVEWMISLSTSNETDTRAFYSTYGDANNPSGQSVTISNFAEPTYYPWFYFRDDLGNTSTGECLVNMPFYVDSAAPEITFTCEDENAAFDENGNNITLYIPSSTTINITVTDDKSGVSEDTLSSLSDKLTVQPGETYSFILSDKAGNSITKRLYVENSSTYGSPQIFELYCYDTSEGKNTTKTITSRVFNTATSTSYYTSTYNIEDMTNGDVTFEFYALSNSDNQALPFAKNGIVFKDMTVKSYKIYEASENNGNYSYGNIIISSDNNSQFSNYIPISKQLTGLKFFRVECELDTTKFVQSKFPSSCFLYDITTVDQNTLNNLAVTVSNIVNSTTQTYTMALDSEGPEFTDVYNTTGVYKLYGKNEDGSYTVKAFKPIQYIDGEQFYCNGNDYFGLRNTSNVNDVLKSYDGSTDKFTGNWFYDIPDGTKFYLEDALGNRTTIVYEVECDDQGPEITADGTYFVKNGIDNYWYSSEKGITITFNDVSDIDRCEYNDGSNNYLFFPDSTETPSSVLSGSETGTTYTITAYDIFGNGSTRQIIIGKDTTAPVCTINSLVDFKKSLFTLGNDSVCVTTYGISINGVQTNRTGLIEDANISVTSGMITNKIGGGYCEGDYNMVPAQAVIFTLTEIGSGVSSIQIVSDSGSRNIDIDKKTYSGKVLVYSNFNAYGANASQGRVSIKVTDMMGNSSVTPITVSPMDTAPSLKLEQGSSSAAFINNERDGCIDVYTGTTSKQYIKPTFLDTDGLNPEWTSASLEASVFYSTERQAMFSKSFTNGGSLEIRGTAGGNVYQLSSQDKLGKVSVFRLRVYSSSNNDALTTLTITGQ